tara:strand:+ start:91 stop:849 length:759 start_codon:yes stop_codon:yes gene_type:complete
MLMIVPRLKGGLGNQLFQIAAAYSHALDVEDNFAINYNITHYLGQGEQCIKYRDNIFSKINSTNIIPQDHYTEVDFSYKPIPNRKNLLLDGYFQSEKYFSKNITKIKKLFDFSCVKENKQYSDLKNKVVLHIRRGDYLENSAHHPTIPVEYYKKCLDFIDVKTPTILVVTDDIKTVSREFVDIDFIHVNGKNEIEDFYYIMNADYIIGGNSSFAWWAAYLSNSKRCIFPEVWFGPAGPQDWSDIYTDKFIIK